MTAPFGSDPMVIVNWKRPEWLTPPPPRTDLSDAELNKLRWPEDAHTHVARKQYTLCDIGRVGTSIVCETHGAEWPLVLPPRKPVQPD